jgi:hypothetical protein
VPRTLLCVAAWAVCSLPVDAEQPAPSAETVIRLTVQPMAAPKPALRYLLLPELKELQPGNPIEGYLRCFEEAQSLLLNKQPCERRNQLQAQPFLELSVQELQDAGKFDLRQADWAARLDSPDWHLTLQIKTGGFGLLLPDLQQMRQLANALKARFQTEVALRRFDDALRTAKTLFAMSRHLGEHPTLIGNLVGVAIAYVAIEPLQEMLEQPGCPNLYWALTNLPDPLVSMVKGMEGERVLVAGEFRDLDSNVPMSKDQIKKLIQHIQKADIGSQKLREWLDGRIKDKRMVSAARQRLVEVGFGPEQLQRFPAEQVMLLDQMRLFEVHRDELGKLMNLPSWQMEALAGQIKPKEEPSLFDGVISALRKVRRVQGRLEQRIALLRHVEALRLYAADHDGQLPEKLSDIAVPLPPDPFTGKPFRYQVEGSTAHLRGTPPAGMEKEAPFNVHYAVTIQK